MTKTLTVCSFILVLFLSGTSYAMKTLRLNPNESKQLTNSALWTVNATCVVQSANQAKNTIKISVLKNQGSVNGKNLNSGQATSLMVKNNDSISVSAQSGTQINLMNKSSQPLKAACST